MATILFVFALVLFVLAGLGVGAAPPGRWNLIAFGLACCVAAVLFHDVLPLPLGR
jgi:hypothetical protein